MSTTAQPTITTTPPVSVWVLAARTIPGFSHRSIIGDGAYGIKLICPLNRKILLFPTSNARRRKLDQLDRSECCMTCEGNHFLVDLTEYVK